MKPFFRLTLCASLAGALLLPSGVLANMYRYTDENGRIVISNTIPQAASKRGYDILNSKGRVVETVDPAPTAEEIAAREAEERRKEAEAHQRELDKKLLERFTHPDEAVQAMHRKIRELESLSQLKRGNIAVIENQLDSEQSRAADRERSGQKVPEATLNKIQRLESQIRDIEDEIASQKAEIATLKQRYIDDIERLEIITGKSRTLPLEPSPESDGS